MNINKPNLKIIRKCYDILLEYYGEQGWWPVGANRTNEPSYTITNKNRIMSHEEKWEIIVGSILTQNTNWKNVIKSFADLANPSFPSPKEILDMDLEKLAMLIYSSGYRNQKALRLKNIANFFLENKFDKLSEYDIPRLRNILLSLNGIGNETADSIILYAFSKPSFVVDAYTKRLLIRLNLISEKTTYNDIQNIFHENLPKDSEIFNEYHALIVEHGKKHCQKTKPICETCPLSIDKICSYQI